MVNFKSQNENLTNFNSPKKELHNQTYSEFLLTQHNLFEIITLGFEYVWEKNMLLAFQRKLKQFLKIPERADFLPYQLGCCEAIDRHKHFFTYSVDIDENQDGLALEPLTKGQLISD